MSKKKKHNISQTRKAGGEPYLVMRFGGMGDIMFCTPVCRALKKDGYHVIVATNDFSAPLLENNPDVDEIWIQKRMGPVGAIDGRYPVDLTKIGNVFLPTLGLYEQFKAQPKKSARPSPLYPNNVVNYFRVIENNTLHDPLWPTQGSDFINTYDTHLSWAHIDPQSLTRDQRRPRYFPTDKEIDWAKNLLSSFTRPIVLLQPYASSPVRTYYRMTDVISKIRKYKGTLIMWEPSNNNPHGGIWRILSSTPENGKEPQNIGKAIPWPDEEICSSNIRATAALIHESNLLISADTCVSHLAEAQNRWHITYYTSVPAHTRSRDYRYEFTVDSSTTVSNDSSRICKCGIIGRDCPRKLRDAVYHLSDMERQLLTLLPDDKRNELDLPNLGVLDTGGLQPHEYFKMTPQALQEAVKGAISKYESIRQSEAYCAQTIDLESKIDWVMSGERWAREAKDE